MLSFYKDEILKSEQTRCVGIFVSLCLVTDECSAMVGNIFLHLAVEGSSADIRRLAISSMNTQAPKLPAVINRIVSASLKAHLLKEAAPSKAQATEESESKAVSKEGRLCSFLISCAGVGEDVDSAVKEKLVLDLVVVSHHPTIGMSRSLGWRIMLRVWLIVGAGTRIPWIDLCQAASVDPHSVVISHWGQILPQIISASEVSLRFSCSPFMLNVFPVALPRIRRGRLPCSNDTIVCGT